MGIQIIRSGGEKYALDPFKKGKMQRTVKLWCDLHTNQFNLEFRKAGTRKTAGELFVVEFSVDAFRQISKTSGESLRRFSGSLKKKTAVTYSPQPLAMDAATQQCIYRIIHYNGDEEVKTMFIHAEIIGILIALQLSFKKATQQRSVHIRNDYDKERILYARDYLITHLDAPPSIPQLAAIVGINTFKLKCGFKELFCHTPFAYLADVRLEMARTAIRKKEKTITQIAFELGYASPQHFSSAFKKKFGVAPARFEK